MPETKRSSWQTQEELMSPETLAKRPAADRAKMFSRMKRGFSATMKMKRVAANAGADPRR